jgi:hypothetical protein
MGDVRIVKVRLEKPVSKFSLGPLSACYANRRKSADKVVGC